MRETEMGPYERWERSLWRAILIGGILALAAIGLGMVLGELALRALF